MNSIRLYLIIVLLSTVCLVNFTAAFNGYQRSTSAGNNILDERLNDMAHMLERLYLMNGEVDRKLFDDEAIFQIWQHNQLRYYSSNAPDTQMISGQSDFHIVNHSGVQWRAYVLHSSDSSIAIIYGERYDVYRKLIDDIILESLLPIIWVLPIIGLLIWLIVSYGLRPISLFSDKLRKRSATELKEIKTDGFPRELFPLLESTNSLFNRLSDAFEREQRFAADAAHELRTPLAALKVNLYNYTKDNDSDNKNIIDLQNSAKRMESSIEQILTLYKLTPETFNRALSKNNLTTIVQQTLIDIYPLVESKNQKIELKTEDCEIETASFSLSILITNLIENASKYTPEGGSIFMQTQACGDYVILRLEDSGPGIPEDAYDRVFDRFYRLGGDRHNSTITGSGLGLSIVNFIVKLHNGQIDLEKSTLLGGLAVLVKLPKSQFPVNKI